MASADGEVAAGHLARLAAASLVAEARLTPKPGLVDRRTNGAHTDMDLATFLASAAALEPFLSAYAAAGFRLGADGADAAGLADEMRRIGIDAERAMFAATGGVNTHKGANFTFALILGAAGSLLSEGRGLPLSPADTDEILDLVSRMGACLLDHDVRDLLARSGGPGSGGGLTHGERIFLESGIKGIRGEAALGYPRLRELLLPYLRGRRSELACAPDAGDVLLRALVKLMAVLEDTNVVHRGGMGALADHRAFCRALDERNLPEDALVDELIAYDGALIARNVSPGGAADLLSLGIFFGLLEGILSLDALDYRRTWTFEGAPPAR